jgi:hypothetical protein
MTLQVLVTIEDLAAIIDTANVCATLAARLMSMLGCLQIRIETIKCGNASPATLLGSRVLGYEFWRGAMFSTTASTIGRWTEVFEIRDGTGRMG